MEKTPIKPTVIYQVDEIPLPVIIVVLKRRN
jgi:hypothetical protein